MTTRVSFVLTLWTGDTALARAADRAGVNRIGPDLETFGKARRQAGQGTWITQHRVEHLASIREVLQHAALFVRSNPLHPGSRDEVERLLDLGVQVLMLPNFSCVSAVEEYLRLVSGRAKVIPLLERIAAVTELERLVAIRELDEIHIGLNDLSIDLRVENRLAFLTSDLLRDIASMIAGAGLRLGIGGIARAGDERLPIAADLVYAQYPRLNATAALLSRSFAPEQLTPEELRVEVNCARERMDKWFSASQDQLDRAFEHLRALCDASIDLRQ